LSLSQKLNDQMNGNKNKLINPLDTTWIRWSYYEF